MPEASPKTCRARAVTSPQRGPHPELTEVVARHLRHPHRKPIAEHTRRAHEALRAVLAEAPERPVVLDSGCGTGSSTHRLAHLHPAAWVVGVDQSAHRLGFSDGLVRRGPRVVLLRAEQHDLWRLLAREGRRLGASYLIHPNPWPKKGHLKRRVHGHPSFSALLALGGRLEARSNWSVFLDELAAGIRVVTGASARPYRLPGSAPPLSPFERKYREAGQDIFSLRVCLREPHHWPIQQGVAASQALTDGNSPFENS